ncbi:MAG TPA: hypothetical protein VKU19_29770 [Bryobacteraceae bacterium]|nr:hypothetical protein [Bryobacteraceae bacterium]
MTTSLFATVCLLLFVQPVAGQRLTATELLAKAREAFAQNRERQDHWNWTTTEERAVVDRAGRTVQPLPSVTVESVIRKDGRRCNAVLSWGDGVAPYKLNEDADTRCAGQEPTDPPFRMDALLQSATVKLGPRSRSSITLQIQPDKSRDRDPQHEVRCTASIQATLRLDPATYFPTYLEGKVVDSGCEGDTTQELHYGEDPIRAPLHRLLRKGTEFRLQYTLQVDRFGNQANSYWIASEQHWKRPFQPRASGIVYSNRLFRLQPNIPGPTLVQDDRTSAREFGAVADIRVETDKP